MSNHCSKSSSNDAYHFPVKRSETVRTEIRIVAGSLRGRKITARVHAGLRPTPQRVREALFSILGNAIPARSFIDVFAGTGVIGFEALSRGASEVRFIESDARLATSIEKLAADWAVRDRVQVLRADAYRWAERWLPPAEPVTVFVSPPFPDLVSPRSDLFLGLVNTLRAKLPADSVFVLQVEQGFPLDAVPDAQVWDNRVYGRNILMFTTTES